MITLTNVSVTYPGAVEALRPLSLTLAEGGFTVLLGRSGAGKSTLLRCLNLLVQPTFGSIEVEGIGRLVSGPAVRRHRCRTAMIFQLHQLLSRYSALHNVLLGRLPYHGTVRSLFPLPAADQVLALRCLERVGLLEKAQTRVDSLSGGQRQRVGIARALCQEPRILLADEPVASLDPATAGEVMTLLQDVSRSDRLTAVVSLHQVELAREFAQRVIGLRDGNVVFDGPTDRLDATAVRRIYGSEPEAPESVPTTEQSTGQESWTHASASKTTLTRNHEEFGHVEETVLEKI